MILKGKALSKSRQKDTLFVDEQWGRWKRCWMSASFENGVKCRESKSTRLKYNYRELNFKIASPLSSQSDLTPKQPAVQDEWVPKWSLILIVTTRGVLLLFQSFEGVILYLVWIKSLMNDQKECFRLWLSN